MKCTLHKLVAFLLVVNYISFHAEFFDNEYEQNHRTVSSTSSIDTPSVTWETFDKANAPQAFTFNVEIVFTVIRPAYNTLIVYDVRQTNNSIIRDKSPPPTFLAS